MAQEAGSQLHLAIVGALCAAAAEGTDPDVQDAAIVQLASEGLMGSPMRLPAAITVLTQLRRLLEAPSFPAGSVATWAGLYILWCIEAVCLNLLCGKSCFAIVMWELWSRHMVRSPVNGLMAMCWLSGGAYVDMPAACQSINL